MQLLCCDKKQCLIKHNETKQNFHNSWRDCIHIWLNIRIPSDTISIRKSFYTELKNSTFNIVQSLQYEIDILAKKWSIETLKWLGFIWIILLLSILEVYRNIFLQTQHVILQNFHWSRAQCLDPLLKASLNYPTRLLSSNGIFIHSFLHFLWTWILKTSGMKYNFLERIRHDY